MRTLRDRKTEQGFTLIEIIAVLLLLGFLAAVIVPKYNSLVDDAKKKAVSAALAEGIARINVASANYILTNGSAPSSVDDLNQSYLTSTAGDYQLKFTGPNPVIISAIGTGANVVGVNGTSTVTLPQ